MAFALVTSVQVCAAASGGTSASVDTTGATLIVIDAACFGGMYTAGQVTDSKGNSYTKLTTRTNANNDQLCLYYCLNPTVGTGHTFTIGGATYYVSARMLAFSGADASSYDQESGRGTLGISPATPGSITPAGNDQVFVLTSNVAATAPGSPTDSFTRQVATNGSGGSYEGGSVAYLIQTTGAALNPYYTTGSVLCAAMATFKPAAGGGGGGGYIHGAGILTRSPLYNGRLAA